ncbi:MAG TPA: AI-2E family transporter, partial [Candidatus Baltobacteraceae bacterium]|nr:AI-2E family transporter [Candidatus Baltobacteraceae bacterium]
MQAALDPGGRRRLWMTIGVIVLLAVALWFATKIPKTIAIFLIAAFLASAIHPIVNVLEQRRIPRAWAITIVYAALIIFTVILLVVIVPMTVDQTQALVANVPAFLNAVQTWLLGVQATLHDRFPEANIPTHMLNVTQMGG